MARNTIARSSRAMHRLLASAMNAIVESGSVGNLPSAERKETGMSEFHEQAVRDVAEATHWSESTVRRALDGDTNYIGSDDLTYAVSQRERVLQLEARMRSISRRFGDADNGTLHVRDGVAWAMANDAKTALAEPEREKGK